MVNGQEVWDPVIRARHYPASKVLRYRVGLKELTSIVATLNKDSCVIWLSHFGFWTG